MRKEGRGRGREDSIFFPKEGEGLIFFRRGREKKGRGREGKSLIPFPRGREGKKMEGEREGRLDFLPCQLVSCLFSTTLNLNSYLHNCALIKFRKKL